MSMNPNNYENLKLRALKRKFELVMLRGGKCEICGYNKNVSALEFHHINPDEKEFQLDSRHLSNTSMDKLIEEFKKCLLLCANCHREVHNNDLAIENVLKLIQSCDKKSISNMNEHGSICPVCGKQFPKCTGKIYCSKECREKDKHYPSYDELMEKYSELKSWDKTAEYFGITRKITQGIRKKHKSS